MKIDPNIQKSSNEIKKNQLLYPEERIVVFLNKYFKDLSENMKKKGLDIGFGSGRNMKLFSDFGIEAYGIDYSSDAKETACALFGDHLKRDNMFVSDVSDFDSMDLLFDAVIYYGSAFFKNLEGMKRDLEKVHQFMADNGKMLINFRSKENWFYGKGRSLDGLFYSLDETAGPYSGYNYTFLDYNEAEQLLIDSGFCIENYEILELTKNMGKEKHSWYIFWVSKTNKIC
ncbi:class I SAM-dependent methyltransferase [Paenibacillus sp. IB182496]|uniref:Class I SAM-dependent methyltransferase n=1 Tax=Paenibacillus sabuli TaxID=2772509 RepID=A0A927BS73_9BACL|nr:class I SAM-dependent methyltransferase [Paenibacillus sabuli]MBD2845818.1 class I SAM-dependent methyltransferase [Paenibacillus sabuli]